jgi:hypothetical protein
MPRRARMHGSGHRRLLKNEFFSNLLVWCPENNFTKISLTPTPLPEGEGFKSYLLPPGEGRG